ncbi:hypothetical protein [uncultured Fibrella sp.]|uniref:hypothetical protein n=1 Tax=uncultured Fibrella sp. TaxID=1284596 RepID=UPI0035CAAFAF
MPKPGKITTEQAVEFVKALARGERDRGEIIKNGISNQYNEAIATKGRSLLDVTPGL